MEHKQTRLDRSLSRLAEGYGKILREVLIILAIVEVVEQIVMLTSMNQMLGFFLIGLGVGAVLLEDMYRHHMDKKGNE